MAAAAAQVAAVQAATTHTRPVGVAVVAVRRVGRRRIEARRLRLARLAPPPPGTRATVVTFDTRRADVSAAPVAGAVAASATTTVARRVVGRWPWHTPWRRWMKPIGRGCGACLRGAWQPTCAWPW